MPTTTYLHGLHISQNLRRLNCWNCQGTDFRASPKLGCHYPWLSKPSRRTQDPSQQASPVLFLRHEPAFVSHSPTAGLKLASKMTLGSL